MDMPPSFLILNACSTAQQKAIGNGEALGIITASLLSGAASVLGTSWKVNADAAGYFADGFFDHLEK